MTKDRDARTTPLGNNAESSTPPIEREEKNLRLERYRLQYEARRLLLNVGAAKVKAGELTHKANVHKTAKCLYTRHSHYVNVKKSIEHGGAFYTGLVVCGSPACPVCTAKVEERRRVEIAKAFEWAYSTKNLKVIMVTFTFPHYQFQSLAKLLPMQADAYKRLRQGAPWTRIKERMGFVGLIRSLEVTIGANGWHPHTHEAWLVSKDCDLADFEEKIVSRWLNSCLRAGIEVKSEKAFRKHAVDIIDNATSSDYLAKQDSSKYWGADRELAKGVSKTGRYENDLIGRHPHTLLEDSFNGDIQAGKKYLEYAFATRGKARIFWSKGLKDMVGVNDVTDEEIANRIEDTAINLAVLGADEWAVIVKAGRDARANILDIAESGGTEAILDYVAELESKAEKLPLPKNHVEISFDEAVDLLSGTTKKEIAGPLSIKSETRIDGFAKSLKKRRS